MLYLIFLDQTAQKELYAEAGDCMDTWLVGRKPVGVYKPKSQAPSEVNKMFSSRFDIGANIITGACFLLQGAHHGWSSASRRS